MKKLFALFLFTSSFSLFSQVQIDEQGFKTFISVEGTDTFVMKQYFMVFLNAGPNRSQSAEESTEIQKQHLAHISKLAKSGAVAVAGPFGDEGDTRGILIFNLPTREEVEKLANEDPAVKAGRLVVEIRPWWSAKGATLP